MTKNGLVSPGQQGDWKIPPDLLLGRLWGAARIQGFASTLLGVGGEGLSAQVCFLGFSSFLRILTHVHLWQLQAVFGRECDPWVRRYPEEGKSYPLQFSGLENSMDCVVHGVAKSQTWLSDFDSLHLAKKKNSEVFPQICSLLKIAKGSAKDVLTVLSDADVWSLSNQQRMGYWAFHEQKCGRHWYSGVSKS